MSKLSYDDLFDKYVETFGETFPSRMVSGPDEAMEIMEKCLKSNTPFNPYEEDGFDAEADY